MLLNPGVPTVIVKIKYFEVIISFSAREMKDARFDYEENIEYSYL